MGVHQDRAGSWSFSLGIVEKWIIGAGASALLGGGALFFTSVTKRLDALSMSQATMATQQAVTNANLLTLTALMADIPTMNRDVAELKVRATHHDEAIRDLRSRGQK